MVRLAALCGALLGRGELGSDSHARFAGVLAVGFEKYGSEAELEADAITHLYDVYVKINADGTVDPDSGVAPDPTVHDRAREFFVRMEAGERSVLLMQLD